MNLMNLPTALRQLPYRKALRRHRRFEPLHRIPSADARRLAETVSAQTPRPAGVLDWTALPQAQQTEPHTEPQSADCLGAARGMLYALCATFVAGALAGSIAFALWVG